MKNIILILSFMAFIFSCSRPHKIIKRGSITLEKYYKSGGIGGHAQWPWKIYINNKRFKIKETGVNKFADCFTSPEKKLEVALFSEYKGNRWYLLQIIQNKVKLSKIEKSLYRSVWNVDGKLLLVEEGVSGNYNMLDVISGKFTKFPKFKGEFLCLSPDRKTIVSSEKINDNEISSALIYQTEMVTGIIKTDTIKRTSKSKWLWEYTHYKKDEGSANVWIAKHFKWKKNENNYSLDFSELK